MTPDEKDTILRDLQPVYDAAVTIRSETDPRENPEIWKAAEKQVVQLQGLAAYLSTK